MHTIRITRFILLSITAVVALLSPHAASAANVVNPQGPTNSLVGRWTFDRQNTSGTTAYDTSGQGNTASLANAATLVPGIISQALQFNGSQYVYAGTGLGSGTYTLGTWINTASAGGIIMERRSNNLWYYANYIFAIGSGVLNLTQVDPSNNIHTATGGTVQNKGWVYVTATYDGSYMRLYVNGVQTGILATSAGVHTDGTQYMFMGVDCLSSYTSYFSGSMDDARIYSRALSPTEIQQLYFMGAATHLNATLNPPNLSSGLVGHWSMDGKDLIQNVFDSSSNGNNGYLVGFTSTSTATVPGVIGQALKFDGSSQYVNLGNPTALKITGTAMTVGAWIKVNAWPSATHYPGVVSKTGNTSAPYGGYQLNLDNDSGHLASFCSGINIGGTWQSTCTATTGYATGVWYHVFVTYDGSAVRVYVNGVKDNSANYSGSVGDVSTSMSLGRNEAFPTGAYFNGTLDDVRIYNRALSQAEITQLYKLGAATHLNATLNPPNLSSGLVGHWSMDGKDLIQNVFDSSSNGNNGYLVGFTSTSTATVPGVIGQALKFDGSSQYVNVSGTLPAWGTGGYTLSAWVKPASTAAGFIVGEQISGGQYIQMEINRNCATGANNAGWLCGAATNNGTGYLIGNVQLNVVPVGVWTHVVVVRSSSTTFTIYVNGISKTVTMTNADAVSLPSLSAITIGNNTVWNDYFAGSIDDVRIYNRALSATEVTQLYHLGR